MRKPSPGWKPPPTVDSRTLPAEGIALTIQSVGKCVQDLIFGGKFWNRASADDAPHRLAVGSCREPSGNRWRGSAPDQNDPQVAEGWVVDVQRQLADRGRERSGEHSAAQAADALVGPQHRLVPRSRRVVGRRVVDGDVAGSGRGEKFHRSHYPAGRQAGPVRIVLLAQRQRQRRGRRLARRYRGGEARGGDRNRHRRRAGNGVGAERLADAADRATGDRQRKRGGGDLRDAGRETVADRHRAPPEPGSRVEAPSSPGGRNPGADTMHHPPVLIPVGILPTGGRRMHRENPWEITSGTSRKGCLRPTQYRCSPRLRTYIWRLWSWPALTMAIRLSGCCSTAISASGSPSMTSRSARFPGSMVPVSAAMPSSSALVLVGAIKVSCAPSTDALMASSRGLCRAGGPSRSEPDPIRTPAARARRSPSSPLPSTRSSLASCAAVRPRSRPCSCSFSYVTNVGTRKVPFAAMSFAVASSRKFPCSIDRTPAWTALRIAAGV